MSPWILLLFTIVAALVTIDAFRWGGSLKDAPASNISNMWKGGIDHLPLIKQNEIKNRYASSIFGVFQFQLVFLVVTLCLAVATIRAFMDY